MTEWHNPTAHERMEIIRSTSSVAIVGMSADPSRASHFVATYLLSASCSFDDVWFVNPKGGEVLGQPVYPSLADLPGVPDLVDVFRKEAGAACASPKKWWPSRERRCSGPNWG